MADVKDIAGPKDHLAFFENRRVKKYEELGKLAANVVLNNRVVGSGPNVRKVSWEEYEDMHRDYRQAVAEGLEGSVKFRPQSTYVRGLTHYSDGRPRVRPLRPLLVNEVGMIDDVIVVLKDAGPGDVGEGKYFQVPADAPVGEK
jgi:hypothetical protein